ncbi:hypothetical protein BH20GEM1_BH20GEM1_01320 [soil metagenome]
MKLPLASPARVFPALGMILLAAIVASCAVILSKDSIATAHDAMRPVEVESPARVHMADGSVIVYPQGFALQRDTILGPGTRYGLSLKGMEVVRRLAVDSVAAIESYRVETNTGRSVGYSLAVTGAIWSSAVLACLAFCGSCPTIYSPDGTLEAEAFSYSIAPVFEARDVDRLFTRADADGIVTLDVRNEMLETHYINQFELIEVRHADGERVAVDPQGRAVAFRPVDVPVRAVDREERNLSVVVAAIDGVATRASERSLAGAEHEMEDWIDVTAPAPAGADSVALLLHVRNSPLTTILLYEVMLGGQGVGAVDWIGRDLGRVDHALDLGRWYGSRMGLRASTPDGSEVGRVGDVGPLAWKEVAIVVPVDRDSVRVRLSFVTDAWRIDRIALGRDVRRTETRTVAPTAVVGADGVTDSDALARLGKADERYLETRPGERFELTFDVGPSGEDERTFLLASTGYYVEWIRGAWLESPAASFDPSDAALVEALRRWRGTRSTYEAAFQRVRFPVEAGR